RPAGDDAVAVVGLDPVVVGYADLRGIARAHPDHRATPEQPQHVQVVLVLRVDRPLRVRCQVAHGDLGPALFPDTLLAEMAHVVQRRPVGRQPLAVFGDPVVVEEEVHTTGQGVPRLLAFDIDHERGVAPPAGLAFWPRPRGDPRPWLNLGVGEADPVPGAFLG